MAGDGCYLMEIVADLHMYSACSDGIEVYNPDHSKKQTQYYLEYTQKYNLLVSGGSDFHGLDNKKSVGSFGIGVDYLKNIIDKLN